MVYSMPSAMRERKTGSWCAILLVVETPHIQYIKIAFEGAAYLREIYLPETVSFIGEDAFAGCSSLQGIYYGESTPSAVRGIEADRSGNNDNEEMARYNLSGRPCSPNEKGVQIIVYSDFTTRTVIVD